MLRTEEYVVRNIPIKKLIKRAKLYDNSLFKKHMKKITFDNWYKNYFEAEEEEQNSMYKLFIKELEDDRKEFIKIVDSGV